MTRVVLVDTNVIVSLLIDNDWSDRARELYRRDPRWQTENHALVECTNVLVRYLRNGLMTGAEARAVLLTAETLFADNALHADHQAALMVGWERQVSAYDARFLVVARELGVRLTTEDAKLRHAAPELTQSLEQALNATG